MRFYLEVEVEKNEMPIEIRRVVLSIIKSCLNDAADGRFYNRYYNDKTPIKKDFSFSVCFKEGTVFTKEKIKLSSNIFKIYFSTDDKNKTGLILMNAFLMKKNKSFPLVNENKLKIKNVVQINQELILSSEIVVRTFVGSSIVVREHKKENNQDKYYTIEDNEFNEKMTNIAKIQAKLAGFSEQDIAGVKIRALEGCKKAVVKHYGSFIDCTRGSFIINANTDILQYFYDVGVGSRTGSGFGMLNLVSQSVNCE